MVFRPESSSTHPFLHNYKGKMMRHELKNAAKPFDPIIIYIIIVV